MIDLSLIKVALNDLGRAEGDQYKDLDGNRTDIQAAAVDIHEEPDPGPTQKPTFITAVAYDIMSPPALVRIGVDFETDAVLFAGALSGRDPEFPVGFFQDVRVLNSIHNEIKKTAQYADELDAYRYARNYRSDIP
jgi:hypothetical protein